MSPESFNQRKLETSLPLLDLYKDTCSLLESLCRFRTLVNKGVAESDYKMFAKSMTRICERISELIARRSRDYPLSCSIHMKWAGDMESAFLRTNVSPRTARDATGSLLRNYAREIVSSFHSIVFYAAVDLQRQFPPTISRLEDRERLQMLQSAAKQILDRFDEVTLAAGLWAELICATELLASCEVTRYEPQKGVSLESIWPSMTETNPIPAGVTATETNQSTACLKPKSSAIGVDAGQNPLTDVTEYLLYPPLSLAEMCKRLGPKGSPYGRPKLKRMLKSCGLQQYPGMSDQCWTVHIGKTSKRFLKLLEK